MVLLRGLEPRLRAYKAPVLAIDTKRALVLPQGLEPRITG